MTLAELDLKTEYRSDKDDLVRDFYLPCLQRSKLYRRAVGYFTSRGLSTAAQGITALINGGGRMVLVASPLFDLEDLEAIERGYLAREDAVTRGLLRQIDSVPDSMVRDRLGYLAWLIAEGRLEVRIAIPLDEHGRLCGGIYHEKLGIFSDDNENAVAFTGSPNETAGGLVDNFESIDVFCSWSDSEGRVPKKADNFGRLWNDETARLSVRPFPEAAKSQLLRYRPNTCPRDEVSTWSPGRTLTDHLPSSLWKHQIEAVQSWEDNQRRGIISMATGSGKTRTALAAAQRCPQLQIILVVVPLTALVEQWDHEIREITSFSPCVLVYESSNRWQELLFNRLRAVRTRSWDGPVVVVGTMGSIAGAKFDTVLADANLSGNALLVVDEVHNVGAPTYRRALRNSFGYRLGLSATPTRHFDEEGSELIRDYFGCTVYTYDLRRALSDGHLCPYEYFVYPAYLGQAEYDNYLELTTRISQKRAIETSDLTRRTENPVDGDSEEIKQLLFRRARILKKSQSKVTGLRRALEDHPLRNGLIYCSDNDQLSDVAQLLQETQISYLMYTADTPKRERQSALAALGRGHIRALAAIGCLDEGVDVPSVSEAIIVASSTNKRQFIQRRGRILRKAPGKSVAKLIDVVALPPLEAGEQAAWMLFGELARVKEMAELAENKNQALMSVYEYAKPYGVMLTELISGEGDG